MHLARYSFHPSLAHICLSHVRFNYFLFENNRVLSCQSALAHNLLVENDVEGTLLNEELLVVAIVN